jgi:hypothetical protein
MLLFALLASTAEAVIPAAYGIIQHRFTASVPEGVPPALTIEAVAANVVLVVECTAGAQKLTWESGEVPMGESRTFVLAFDGASAPAAPSKPAVRAASCALLARMANGLGERKALELAWTVTPPPKEGADGDAPPPPKDPAPAKAPPPPTKAPEAPVVAPKSAEPAPPER